MGKTRSMKKHYFQVTEYCAPPDGNSFNRSHNAEEQRFQISQIGRTYYHLTPGEQRVLSHVESIKTISEYGSIKCRS